MPVIGFRRHATPGTPKSLAANTKYLTRVNVPYEVRVPKLTAQLDGLAGGSETQPLRAVIYRVSNGFRIAEGDEVKVTPGTDAAWVDLTFPDAGGVVLSAGEYDIGIIAGSPSTARLATIESVGSRFFGEDTYGQVITTTTEDITLPVTSIKVVSTTGFDGIGLLDILGQKVLYTSKEAAKFKSTSGGSGVVPAETQVIQEGPGALRGQPKALTAEAGEFQVFATYFLESKVPEVDDAHIARYPFSYAQSILGAEPPLAGTSRLAACTWHGTLVHPDRGSFALVRRDSEFSNLVGERIRITTFAGREVFAYVIAEADLEDDISLTRRVFMKLAPLATDQLSVRAEVLATKGEP
jgi:hypothetical protein